MLLKVESEKEGLVEVVVEVQTLVELVLELEEEEGRVV